MHKRKQRTAEQFTSRHVRFFKHCCSWAILISIPALGSRCAEHLLQEPMKWPSSHAVRGTLPSDWAGGLRPDRGNWSWDTFTHSTARVDLDVRVCSVEVISWTEATTRGGWCWAGGCRGYGKRGGGWYAPAPGNKQTGAEKVIISLAGY